MEEAIKTLQNLADSKIGFGCKKKRQTTVKDLACQKRWRQRNPERVRENNRRSSAKHRLKNLEKNKDYMLRKKYGIGTADKIILAKLQNGRCAICLKPEGKLYVDHNHSTGQIRKLLCKHCNWGLGSFCEDPAIMLRAIEYLRVLNGAAGASAYPVPDATVKPDDTCAPVAWRELASDLADDYGRADQNAVELDGLQDWVKQQAASAPPDKQ